MIFSTEGKLAHISIGAMRMPGDHIIVGRLAVHEVLKIVICTDSEEQHQTNSRRHDLLDPTENLLAYGPILSA